MPYVFENSDIEIEIKNRIKEIIINNTEKLSKDLLYDTELNDIGISSIEHIKIIVQIENEYGIEFDDTMLSVKYFKTINNLAEYIYSKII